MFSLVSCCSGNFLTADGADNRRCWASRRPGEWMAGFPALHSPVGRPVAAHHASRITHHFPMSKNYYSQKRKAGKRESEKRGFAVCGYSRYLLAGPANSGGRSFSRPACRASGNATGGPGILGQVHHFFPILIFFMSLGILYKTN